MHFQTKQRTNYTKAFIGNAEKFLNGVKRVAS